MVLRAVELAEDQCGLPPGTIHSVAELRGLSNPIHQDAVRRMRAMLCIASDYKAVVRTTGAGDGTVKRAVEWVGDLPEVVAGAQLLKQLIADSIERRKSAWPTLSRDPLTFGVEAAEAMGTKPNVVTATLSQALKKLGQKLDREAFRSAGRSDLGKCLVKAMQYRALATALCDIADAAGVPEMDVARAFVALRKGGAR